MLGRQSHHRKQKIKTSAQQKEKPPSHRENRLSNRIAKFILALLRDEFGFFIISLLYMFSAVPIVEITGAQSTVTIRAVNERLRGSLRVAKQDRSGALRAGAVYLLEIAQNGGNWQPVTAAECSSAGLTDGTLTAGADGTVCFDGLPADSAICYRLTEIRVPEGCSLLAEPLFTGSLPAENPEISLTAVDDLVPVLPMTGGSGLWLSAVGILAASAALWLLFRHQSVPQAQA